MWGGLNCVFVAGTSGSPQENCHNSSSHHSSDLHGAQSKPADRVRPEASNYLLDYIILILLVKCEIMIY